ncbi:MAG: PAS domain S-box protein, partial [Bacteroidales bacterium]|nr:PAS domain S-box protein [Bacteroidales bacterium]
MKNKIRHHILDSLEKASEIITKETLNKPDLELLKETLQQTTSYLEGLPSDVEIQSLKFLNESTEDLIWVNDSEGNLVYVSPSIESMFGYKPREIIGTPVINYFASDQKAIVLKLVETWIQSRSNGTSELGEFEMITKDGRTIPVEVNASPVYDSQGNLKLITGISRDISKRKNTEKQLNKSKNILRYLAEMALELATLQNEQEIFAFITRKIYQIHESKTLVVATDLDETAHKWKVRAFEGLEDQSKIVNSLLGKPIMNLHGKIRSEYLRTLQEGKLVPIGNDISHLSHQSIPPFIAKNLKKVLGVHEVYTISFTKGKRQYGNISIVQLDKNMAMETELIEAVIRQVSAYLEKRIVVDELNETEERLKHIVKHGNDLHYIHDINHVLTYVSPHCMDFFGYTEEEMK